MQRRRPSRFLQPQENDGNRFYGFLMDWSSQKQDATGVIQMTPGRFLNTVKKVTDSSKQPSFDDGLHEV